MSKMFTFNGKPIPEFPGYLASRAGQIYSLKSKKVLSLIEADDGHRYVFLYRQGKMTKCWVHRLVLLTFIGPPSVGQEARHLNDLPFDNRLENLAWGTHLENQRDKVLNGYSTRGEKSWSHKLTEADVLEIRRIRPTTTLRALGAQFGVSHTAIRRAFLGIKWGYL